MPELKLQVGHVYETRYKAQKVRIICTNCRSWWPVIGLYEGEDGREMPVSYHADGRTDCHNARGDFDLIREVSND